MSLFFGFTFGVFLGFVGVLILYAKNNVHHGKSKYQYSAETDYVLQANKDLLANKKEEHSNEEF